MSFFVSGMGNLFADLQSLLQQTSPTNAGGTASGSPPEMAVFAIVEPGDGATSSSPGLFPMGSFANDAMTPPGNWPFAPTTFAALFGIMDGASANAGASQPTSANSFVSGSAGASAEDVANAGFLSGQNLLNAADAGASAQTTTNANGSTSTTITYADGSTVTLTTPAPSNNASSSDNSSSTSGSSGSNTGSSTTGTTEAASNSTPGLETLIAAQANALSTQALWSALTGGSGNSGGNTDGGSVNGGGEFGIGNAENLLAMLTSGDSGATSQVTDNPNGSTTTTITYADGSTVALTTAAPSSSATGSDSSTGTDPASVSSGLASYNLIEQMIQIQAQLLNPTTQNISA